MSSIGYPDQCGEILRMLNQLIIKNDITVENYCLVAFLLGRWRIVTSNTNIATVKPSLL